MKIVCISDTHCKLDKINIPEGDILVHAGDALSRGTYKEWRKFITQYSKLPHEYKIYVPGNHDRITEENETLIKQECQDVGVIYLNNSGFYINGLHFWGSAITPRFHNWAWNRDSGICGTSIMKGQPEYNPIEPYWEAISDKTDILITHGPPYGIMDVSIYNGVNCGCKRLLKRVEELKPRYHIFGHIHFFGGRSETLKGTTFINASICNEQYDPENNIQVIDI